MTIEGFLSPERLAPFRIDPNDSEELVLERYLWNLELASAFYGPLHVFEIGMRNAVDRAFSNAYGPDWLTATGILAKREADSVLKAINELAKRRESQSRGKLIAELMFGFWVGLFYKTYENSPLYSQKNPPPHSLFWPSQIKSVFPHAPKSMQTRKAMSARIEDIKKFRNRIFHHEPIWRNARLAKIHSEICETARWISPDAEVLLARSRVPEMINQTPAISVASRISDDNL